MARFSPVLFAAAVVVTTPFAAASPAKAAPAAQWPDVSGIYWTNTYSPKIQPVGGGDPPYKPEAMEAYRKNMEAVKTFSLNDKARKVCTPDGVPRILIIYELNHVIRLVTMTKPLPSPDELETFPFYSGHSAGHWDGDTLVVETAGFNERTFLDNSGAPHTDQLRTIERIRKINGGKELEDVVTIHDPGVFTKDWSARFVYQSRPDIRMMDYACGEKHRDLSSVKGVQRR